LYSQPYPISRLGIEQGLSNNYIVSITQDKDGFLWFATEEGLNRFDGTRFINYYKHTNSISANELNCVYADPDKPVIWIATQRAGLNAYNYEKNTLKVYLHDDNDPHSIITNDVTAITPSADGNLWISTYRRGFNFFDKENETFTHYNTSIWPELQSDNLWTILDDHNGNIYLGHVRQGLSVLSLNRKEIKNFKHDPNDPNSLPGNSIRCIYKDKNNHLWIGTNRGLALFNPEDDTFTMLDDKTNLLSSNIFNIRQMNDNKLWITTEFNGIIIIDLDRYLLKSNDNLYLQQIVDGYNKYSLSNPTVKSIFQDSFHNIWIGTYGGGINFIGRTEPFFSAYDYSPVSDDLYGLNNKVILSLCMDADNKLWVGTDGGGINVLDKGKRTAVYDMLSGNLSHNSIMSVFRDSKNNIWTGTFSNGIYFFDSKTKRFSSIKLNETSSLVTRCFFEDKNGWIWVGSNTGIHLIDPQRREIIRYYNSIHLPEELVRCINQDENGFMWIGTFGQGMAVYTPDMEEVVRFNEQNGFCSNMINHIYKDSENNMWIATNEGLVCFPESNRSTYKIFRRDDGLHNHFIRAITEDSNGNIWFSTNAGISCFLKEANQFRNYNHFSKAPMGSFSNAAVIHEKGMIYFGSINGVRYFDPLYVLNGIETPPVIISEMNIYEKQAAQDESMDMHYYGKDNQVKLNYKQNTFSITFNIQDYSLAYQVDYAYRLKGLSDLWYTVNDNQVVFRNMSPGRYEFQVKNRIRNSEWSESSNSLFIHVTPPLWLSWYAKVLYVFLVLSIVVFLLHLYKKRLELQSSYEMAKKNYEQELELDNERLRFYTNIAHELRTPLTLILGPLEDLQKDTQLLPRQSQKISVVRQSAIRLLNLINQILEFRKTETQNKKLVVSKGNIAALVKEIGFKYKELTAKPTIKFSFSTEQDDMPLYFDKETVTIILDNLISNAIKYTDEGSIKLELYSCVKSGVSYTEIKVEDTGVGIPIDEQSKIFDRYYQAKRNKNVSGTGIGLALVKNMVALHEGEVRVESKPNEGSCFYFSLLTHNIYPNAIHDGSSINSMLTVGEELPDNETSGKPILLVVEDNPDIRYYISESFSDSFEVVTANEGEEGCNKAFSYIPDIIVCDIMMPRMDGIEFCRKIKEDIRTSHIPVILLTAKDSISDKEEGYASGADSYLTKPFSATLLHSRINNLLESRKKIADRLKNNILVNNKSSVLKESINQLDNEFIQRIVQIIEINMEYDKIDIAYLSDKLFMSSSTLYRKMKALTGISANEFIRKIKMNKAEQLILQGKYYISEIAYKVGINNPVYFRQCFKEEFGLTPSDYLKKLSSE
jgi:signal transduction histidine kinase/ligand-binding sensor domain-containing protein/DNA-binding response OmpR family regulator